MNIVCPNCGTSYDVDASALGPGGRTVRCVRCRETWHAALDDMAQADALVEAADEIGWNQAGLQTAAPRGAGTQDHGVIPQVESPPLAHDGSAAQEWTVAAQEDAPGQSRPSPSRRLGLRKFAFGSGPIKSFSLSPSIAIAAMA